MPSGIDEDTEAQSLNPSAQSAEPLRWSFWFLSILSSYTSQRCKKKKKKSASGALAGVAQFIDHYSVH